MDAAIDSIFDMQIGSALKKLFEEGVVKREDLWITSKLWFVSGCHFDFTWFSFFKLKLCKYNHAIVNILTCP